MLVGGDAAPTPVELLLAALASCLTSGLGNIAAVRKITWSRSSPGRGRHRPARDPRPAGEVRNGFQRIRVSFRVRGDAPPRAAPAGGPGRARSAVHDVLTHGVPISVDVAVG